MPYSFVLTRAVEFMLAVIKQEIVKSLLQEVAIGRVAKGAPNQHGRAVADIGSDDVHRQFLAPVLEQHGIDRRGQVAL